MSGERSLGAYAGLISIGTVVDVENDPSQSGMVRVRWQTGSATQDKIQDDDLPWTRVLFPATNPSLSQTGGPHTGLRVGSTVVGIPLDGSGQEFLVIGTIVRGGSGGLDSPPVYDSDIPQPSKVQSNGGETQPRFGDVNSVVSQESITRFGETLGGSGLPARFAGLVDSIGDVSSIRSGLLSRLESLANSSGSIRSAPLALSAIKGAISSLPMGVSAPAMSALVDAGRVASGLVGLIHSLGSVAGLGDLSSVLSRLQGELGTGSILDADPERLARMLQRMVGDELARVIGPANALSAAVLGGIE